MGGNSYFITDWGFGPKPTNLDTILPQGPMWPEFPRSLGFHHGGLLTDPWTNRCWSHHRDFALADPSAWISPPHFFQVTASMPSYLDVICDTISNILSHPISLCALSLSVVFTVFTSPDILQVDLFAHVWFLYDLCQNPRGGLFKFSLAWHRPTGADQIQTMGLRQMHVNEENETTLSSTTREY